MCVKMTKMKTMKTNNLKVLSNNKKSKYDYFLSDCLEVGLVLTGAEVKSIISGNISLKESYVKIINNEVFLIGAQITPAQNLPTFDFHSQFNPHRDKKLLLNKKQIRKFAKLTQEKGTTLIMRDIYVADNGKLKGTVCVGTGKKSYDKREVIKQRDLSRRES